MNRIERRKLVVGMIRDGVPDDDIALLVGTTRIAVQQIRKRWLPELTVKRRGVDRAPASADGLEWAQRAACLNKNPEIFFPFKGGTTLPAKRICAACQVRSECLERALSVNERYGVWGGLSERERRRLAQRGVA